MKFSKDHYDILRDKILEVSITENTKEAYSNLSKKRFRWDLFWASKVKIGDGIGTQGDIIGDYNDDHIDTVLRVVVKELNLQEFGI